MKKFYFLFLASFILKFYHIVIFICNHCYICSNGNYYNVQTAKERLWKVREEIKEISKWKDFLIFLKKYHYITSNKIKHLFLRRKLTKKIVAKKKCFLSAIRVRANCIFFNLLPPRKLKTIRKTESQRK